MCMLLSVKSFGVAVFHTSMINWRGYICPNYMCIVLYVKHIWCSSIPYICHQLEVVTSALTLCALCYMVYIFCVLVFHKCMGSWSGVHVPYIYVHSALC